MADYLLKVDNVSKFYSKGGRERQSLSKYLSSMFSSEQSREDEAIWALQNISFEIQRGETLGIIGSNGSGKSTLLSILGGITKPSHGEVRIRGKVASILEVGTGFHPDLTGRDNVYLNGRMMGLSEAEIDKQFEEIVSFSGIRKFIDTAVKYYSSGMYLRLAFSTLVHFKADLLLFDEVLSVGDAEFKKRCYDKISHIKQGAEAMILVSHQLTELQRFCDRVVYLENGQVQEDGNTIDVINHYFKDVYEREQDNSISNDHKANKAIQGRMKVWNEMDAPGNKLARLLEVEVTSHQTTEETSLIQSDEICVRLIYKTYFADFIIDPGIQLLDEHLNIVFVNAPFWKNNSTLYQHHGIFQAICKIPPYLMNKGVYFLGVQFFLNKREKICEVSYILKFNIHGDNELINTPLAEAPGPILPKLQWELNLIN